jgi:hypothetical protein
MRAAESVPGNVRQRFDENAVQLLRMESAKIAGKNQLRATNLSMYRGRDGKHWVISLGMWECDKLGATWVLAANGQGGRRKNRRAV